ncbi:hypothetical protein NSK_002177 [Nannochloropsis salina CCMP1776]|jgi:glycerol uptake facilitator-like aquaporin|uniref:Aquaporin n=1 Tax=Nannochloropsis salina CCMP1776 TaxID=1027361 RepID=A0A4D9D4Z8_9STRA|nr:hypothetical protein NSK_002177 [Nannochloropsis salina CCMP1776]|eukprot:TFJ86520.1 hypothetical protein NSK_002177 [Nannochloropsis salina CCMP1776]
MFPKTSKDSSHLPGGTVAHAFAIKFVGTMLLMFLILTIVTRNQNPLKNKEPTPLVIGLALASIVSVAAPSMEACLNPARDFGARLVAACFEYGKVVLPGPDHEMWVFIFEPTLGALTGALLRDLLTAPGLRRILQRRQ